MKIAICSHCGKEFEVRPSRYYAWKSRKNNIFCSEECRSNGLGHYRHKNIQCLQCGKDFLPKERTSKFCSRTCAANYNNAHRNPEVWKKQSETLKKRFADKGFKELYLNKRKERIANLEYIRYIALRLFWKLYVDKKRPIVEEAYKLIPQLSEKEKMDFYNSMCKKYTCEVCNKSFTALDKKKTCSDECAKILKNAGAQKGGLKSAEVQSKERRSKNEKMFAELCKQDFENVLTNEAIFNGWDADVILPNEKIAILWNGKWHYEEIKKKGSLKQIQNRDKIKISEIIKAGYTPYIIKDMGKYNPVFVKEEYEKFKSQDRLMVKSLGS